MVLVQQLKELRLMINPQNDNSIRILKELDQNRARKLTVKIETQKDLEKFKEMIKSDPQFEWMKYNKVQYSAVALKVAALPLQ